MENNPHTQDVVPYLEALGLEYPPFTAQPRNERYYLDANLDQHLNQLRHLSQSSPMLLVITGSDGCGKTTLKKMFMKSAAENLQCCEITATAEMDMEAILNQLSSCLDLPQNLGKQATLALVEDKVRNLVRHDRYPVLLVDDAHLLPHESIDLLLYLQQGDEKKISPWHILLFTHPALTTELLQLHLRQHYISLNPFSRQQIQSYLEHRLRVSGLQTDLPFNENDLDKIEQASGGIPAEINQAAHDCLMEKYSRPGKPQRASTSIPASTHKRSRTLPWLGAAVLSFVVAGGLIFQDEINRLFQTGITSKDMRKESLKLPDENTYLLKKMPKDLVIERAKPFVVPETKPKPVANTETSPPKVAGKPVTSVVKTPVPAAPAASDGTQQKPASITTAPPTIKDVKTPVTTIQRTPAAQTGTGTPSGNIILGKSWVLAREPGHYTIQLAAAAKPEALQQLAANNKLGDPKAIIVIQRNARDWNVLLYGNFKDWQQALDALAGLPKNLLRNHPWARKFEKIQQEIRQSK